MKTDIKMITSVFFLKKLKKRYIFQLYRNRRSRYFYTRCSILKQIKRNKNKDFEDKATNLSQFQLDIGYICKNKNFLSRRKKTYDLGQFPQFYFNKTYFTVSCEEFIYSYTIQILILTTLKKSNWV